MTDALYTVPIDDSSPLIQYTPHGDGGMGDQTETGWQPWYSGSGGFNTEGGADGLGMSYHVTALPGARFDFQFYGTSISLYGNTTCSYQVSLDGDSKSFPASEGTLYAQDSLPEQLHNVSVTADASTSSTFWFDRADISRPKPSGAGAPVAVVYPATNSTNLQYTGDWTVQTDPNGQIPSIEDPAPFYEVADAPASLSFSFNGTGVAVNGSRNWGSWTYDVNLDGVVGTYNASTMWLVGDALLFYRDGLDPRTTHTVKIVPRIGGGFKFWLNSVTVLSDGSDSPTPTASSSQSGLSSPTTVNPSTSSSASSSGKSTDKTTVIAGSVFGGIMLLLAILLVVRFVFCNLHRRRTAPTARTPTRAQPSPYMMTPRSPAGLQDPEAGTAFTSTSRLTEVAASPYLQVPQTAASAISSSPSSYVTARQYSLAPSSPGTPQMQRASPATVPDSLAPPEDVREIATPRGDSASIRASPRTPSSIASRSSEMRQITSQHAPSSSGRYLRHLTGTWFDSR